MATLDPEVKFTSPFGDRLQCLGKRFRQVKGLIGNKLFYTSSFGMAICTKYFPNIFL